MRDAGLITAGYETPEPGPDLNVHLALLGDTHFARFVSVQHTDQTGDATLTQRLAALRANTNQQELSSIFNAARDQLLIVPNSQRADFIQRLTAQMSDEGRRNFRFGYEAGSRTFFFLHLGYITNSDVGREILPSVADRPAYLSDAIVQSLSELRTSINGLTGVNQTLVRPILTRIAALLMSTDSTEARQYIGNQINELFRNHPNEAVKTLGLQLRVQPPNTTDNTPARLQLTKNGTSATDRTLVDQVPLAAAPATVEIPTREVIAQAITGLTNFNAERLQNILNLMARRIAVHPTEAEALVNQFRQRLQSEGLRQHDFELLYTPANGATPGRLELKGKRLGTETDRSSLFQAQITAAQPGNQAEIVTARATLTTDTQRTQFDNLLSRLVNPAEPLRLRRGEGPYQMLARMNLGLSQRQLLQLARAIRDRHFAPTTENPAGRRTLSMRDNMAATAAELAAAIRAGDATPPPPSAVQDRVVLTQEDLRNPQKVQNNENITIRVGNNTAVFRLTRASNGDVQLKRVGASGQPEGEFITVAAAIAAVRGANNAEAAVSISRARRQGEAPDVPLPAPPVNTDLVPISGTIDLARFETPVRINISGLDMNNLARNFRVTDCIAVSGADGATMYFNVVMHNNVLHIRGEGGNPVPLRQFLSRFSSMQMNLLRRRNTVSA